ncbi:VOC family protein [Ferrovibrio sp.]|uniref:VOC family protein n=1 Tax=Ferrovibrio sp. TaxID=1917215 RepID=UPI0035B4BEFF
MTQLTPDLTSNLTPDLTGDLQAPRISEIVLRSSNYDAMKLWYQAVLGVQPFYEYVPVDWAERAKQPQGRFDTDIRLCFMRVQNQFPYSQVIALFDVPGLQPEQKASGLHHMQLRHDSFATLMQRYGRLRDAGVAPYKSFNHGPATAFYYEDPDGNLVELSAANFETEAAFLGFFQTPAFKKNPAGIPIDGDDFRRRFQAGENLSDITRIPD